LRVPARDWFAAAISHTIRATHTSNKEVPMPIAMRTSARGILVSVAGLLLGSLVITGCTSNGGRNSPVDLENSQSRVEFNSGRVNVYLIDEEGAAIPAARVDFSWDKPQFHKVSAITDRTGYASFRDVPEIAEVSVEYPGGNYNTRMAVPQGGSSDLRLSLNTYGENKKQVARLEGADRSSTAGN